jgi:regulatory protein
VIRKRSQVAPEVHRSAAVDLSAIASQAAKALKRNRHSVTETTSRPPLATRFQVDDNENDRETENRSERATQSHAFGKSTFAKSSFGRSFAQAKPLDATKATPQHAYLKAIAWLAGREYSERDLSAKLSRAGFEALVVDEAMQRLKSESLVSNSRFATVRANSLAGRRRGPQLIRAKLSQAGMSKELISETILATEVDWVENALTLLTQKFGCEMPRDRSLIAKRIRFLQARGFDGSVVREVFARMGTQTAAKSEPGLR